MADYDKAFGQTGAGNEEEMNRKKDLKELTSVFSKKNIFGKEKPAEEATQAAILEQNKNVESAIQTLPNQEQLLKEIANVFTAQKADAAESAFEQEQDRLAQNKILEQQTETGQETAEATKVQAKESRNRGSMLGKVGGALAGAGIAAAGIGVALFASAKALKEFEAVNMEKVSGNVKEILEIVPKADGEGALLSFFAEGGTLAAVLGGLGIGLGVFGVGSAAAAAATEFVGFEAETVKNNVLTLLSINDAAGGNFEFLIDSAFFAAAMTGIAAGLAVFGAGSLVSSLGTGAAEGVNKFSSDQNFADTIKANVLTLLSLDEAVGGKANLIGESAVFLVAMSTIAGGLALFGGGAAAASLGQGAAEGIAHFSGDGGFAEQIKQNVITLLSIDDAIEANGDNFLGEGAKFFLAMSTIAGGLALYGAGSAVAGIGSGLANFMSKEGDFAQDIKDKVTTLLSIGDGRDDLKGDADAVEYALKRIGSGISAFGSDSFSNALSNFGTGFVEFFTIGGDKPTPLDIAMKVADKGNSLKAGADGMNILAGAFNRLARISSNNDFKMHPDAIDNLTSFSNAMNKFAGGEYAALNMDGDSFGLSVERLSGPDKTKPIMQVANAFQALADSMDNVSESARNLQSPGVMSGIELYTSGSAANMGTPVIINQVSNTSNVTSAPSTTVVGIEAEGRQLANSATNSD